MENKLDLSIVVPLYNEEENISALLEALIMVCDLTHKNYELVLVNDGSKDKTMEFLMEAAYANPRLKIVSLSRNFGHQAAFSAGMDIASGDMVITMDGDLQHPPRLIPDFLKKADEGHDIVIGERKANKQNSKGREWLNRLFYKFLSSITNLEFKNISDFALYNRAVVSVLRRLPERERYLRGLVQWVGFKKTYIPYVVDERRHGIPKYNFKQLLKLVLSGVTSFSAFPLRLAFWIGLAVLFGGVIFSGYVVYDHYFHPNPLIPGWATVVILVTIIGSVQLLVLGIVGEYLYKMYNEIKGRPTYVISETRNVERDKLEKTPYGPL